MKEKICICNAGVVICVWIRGTSVTLRVNVFFWVQCWDSLRSPLPLPTAVTSVYQLGSMMHALHLGNRPHTDTVLEWGYSVSWHTGERRVWCHCRLRVIICYNRRPATKKGSDIRSEWNEIVKNQLHTIRATVSSSWMFVFVQFQL